MATPLPTEPISRLPVSTALTGAEVVPVVQGGSTVQTTTGAIADLVSSAGSVTSVSVVSAHGFAGTVADPTTTPALTLSTTVTGILQGDGTSVSAATTTGSGSVVRATSPTIASPVLTTPDLGTPSVGVMTNVTGLPVATGISGLASGMATWLAAPSSANLRSTVTDETGTGSLVFATSPTLVTPTLGAATATSLNKITVTAPASSGTLTIGDGFTLTVSGNATVSGTNTGDQTVTLSGDVSGSGTGAITTAIGANKVTLAQMAQVSTATFLGRTTAGTGNVEDLTATQATALINAMVGDSGSGGTKGLVPAPVTGDAAKFLRGDGTWQTNASGTVTSVGASFTGGLISVGGSPVTTSGTLALTVAGTSGGIPYFASTSTWASSALLAANALMIGGGAGVAPATTTTGTGVLTALGVNVGSAGALVTFNGALGTPSSGTATNLSGTAASLTAGNVTTNANLTGPITSSGNATAIASQTGTGTKFVVDTSPTLVTPILGVAAATSINKVTITAPATSAVLTIPDGVTLTGPASSGTAMTLGNAETVTGAKTFGSTGAVGKLKIAGTTSGSTILDATATASGTLTLPAATDTLIGKATTDTLTNKTFDTAGTGNSFSINGVAATANTGTGAVARASSPAFTTPTLGAATATSINFGGQSLSTYGDGQTWTPVVTFATPGDLSVSYSIQVGSYIVIGKLAIASCTIVTSAFTFTTASGLLQVTGLPFTARTLTNANWTVGAAYSGITKTGYNSVSAVVASATSVVSFLAAGTGVASSFVSATDTPTGTSKRIQFTLMYETA